MEAQLIIVIGKTHDNEVFRPSDWSQRLACLAGSVDSLNRIQYNKFVKPTWVYCEGVSGLWLTESLNNQTQCCIILLRISYWRTT